MRCLVGLDDTDSSRGLCTTYLGYRIAAALSPDIKVLPYPRLVRLNPNIPFKTRGNAAVCLKVETSDPGRAFELLSSKMDELSDVRGGANPAMVFLEDPSRSPSFAGLYRAALTGVVSPHRVRRLLEAEGIRRYESGNGMGVVGAASALAFDESFDHTYELISYRRKENWGSKREIGSSSVTAMDRRTFPHTFNNYDYQKRRVLVAPHGPDPVFAGVRGDSPAAVVSAFGQLEYEEQLDGYMVYVSNQHTDAHVRSKLEWKAYASGWVDGTVESVQFGPGGHAYLALSSDGDKRMVAAYEPTGDLRRAVGLLEKGDEIRAYGGVRRHTSLHPAILNLERMDVVNLHGTRGRILSKGTYVSSPRSNRHLTKPLSRIGREVYGAQAEIGGWLSASSRLQRALA